jgi:hypothetical protein
MNANRQPHGRPGSGQPGCAIELGLILGPDDDERPRDARVTRTVDNLMKIVLELLPRQMTVTVDHRTRAPGGISWSKPTSIGLPPSTLPASTIPFDSTPISFAG